MKDVRNKRFAVIGAGISGMTVALLLARHGCRVTLVEKKKTLGPTLRGFSRQGVHFDTGLHYAGGLSPGGPLCRYFHLLGLDDLPLVDFNRDCFDRIRFTDREICLPVGHEAVQNALCRAFPAEEKFIDEYLKKLRTAFFSSSFLNFGEDWKTMMAEEFQAESLDSVLRTGTKNTLLRTVLSMHALLYGVSPEETSFLQHARIAGSYLDGVKTLEGGGKALVNALEKRLAATGVAMVCGTAASAFHFSAQKRITGVLLEDESRLEVDGAVFTAHPKLLPPMLPAGATKPAFTNRLLSLEDTIATFSLFCASKTPIPILQGSNLFICPSDDILPAFRPDCEAENGPFYVSGNAGTAKETAGLSQGFLVFAPGNVEWCAAWQASKTGKRSAAYTACKAEKLESIWNAITTLCPELERATVLDGGTPLTNRDFLESPGCGLYGTKHSLHQFSPLPATRVPNLWMAGQSVIAPGVLGAIISGVVACGLILGMETMRKEVAACR